MASDVSEEHNFHYWWQSHKWKNGFKVEWVYIKDLSYQLFESIKNTFRLF